jgi:uncharacterized phage protein (TIGR02220 family)
LEDKGWILVYRKLLESSIWLNSTPEQKSILITLLLMASYKVNSWEWKGEKYQVKEGQFITSLKSIQDKSGKGITKQNVRTALTRFKKLGFLTYESTHLGSLITIVNWLPYQMCENKTNTVTNTELTQHQHSPNTELTPIKESKEVNNATSIIKIIVDFLNETVKANYKHTSKKTQTLINARLKESFTLDDFKTVITKKAKQWLGNTEFEQYLRPETLFGTKFESYLQACKKWSE